MKVKVEKKCFIGGRVYEAGDVVEFTGKLAKWMTPLEAPAVKMGRPKKTEE